MTPKTEKGQRDNVASDSVCSKHGGRRENQTGRPPKADKKIRIGTLFLAPDDIAHLAKRAADGETLLETARRIIVAILAAPDPEGSDPE